MLAAALHTRWMDSEEQFYNGIMFNIKEFCVKNEMQSKGMGTKILAEVEKRLKSKGITDVLHPSHFTSKGSLVKTSL